MEMTRIWDQDWISWIKEAVAKRTLRCMAGCGDEATRVKRAGRHSGAFCGGCYGELFLGRIPGLDRPRGLKRRQRRR